MEQISQGFDRNVDFKAKKNDLVQAYVETMHKYIKLDPDDRYYSSKKRKIVHRLIYLIIAMTQLINGSRISEACYAVRGFADADEPCKKISVVVKIAKSESVKYKKGTKETYTTKARYRSMRLPTKWITIDFDIVKDYLANIDNDNLKKRVLDYLLKHHDCNTHSLRYAFINHMLYHEKKEPSIVAKFVGHSNLDQIVRYTQRKESDKIFEMDL